MRTAHDIVVKRVTLRQDIVTRLFSLLQSSPYSLIHRQVAETLSEIGSAVVQDQLVTLLSNEQVSALVRGSIADALGEGWAV